MNIAQEISLKKIKVDFKESKYATGRRKNAIAKVWLKKGSGNIYVNGKKMINYLQILKWLKKQLLIDKINA